MKFVQAHVEDGVMLCGSGDDNGLENVTNVYMKPASETAAAINLNDTESVEYGELYVISAKQSNILRTIT